MELINVVIWEPS